MLTSATKPDYPRTEPPQLIDHHIDQMTGAISYLYATGVLPREHMQFMLTTAASLQKNIPLPRPPGETTQFLASELRRALLLLAGIYSQVIQKDEVAVTDLRPLLVESRRAFLMIVAAIERRAVHQRRR